jgi:UDPglucose--hexose-1-phosphate uridylyltransferase
MRWNPVLEQWGVVATHRQDRTFLPPARHCPFCPTRDPAQPTEIPTPDFEIVAFENRFPSFVPSPSLSGLASDGLYRTEPALGKCEVLVYTPDHDSSLARLDVQHIRRLVEVWADRYQELGVLPFVRYVLIFENKGEAVGVTLHHPHGQIYAFPFVPPVVEAELTSSYVHKERTGQCLFCSILEQEMDGRSRVVYENQHALAIVPFYARWPYEVHIFPGRHVSALPELNDGERDGVACALKVVTSKYDNLYGFSFPYVMVIHQCPTGSADHNYYHMHFEFYPPHRTKDKLKFMAGVELGAGTFLLDAAPEDKARELRETPPQDV